MNMRVTGSYPAGLPSPVDKRIGDAFPIIEEVYKHLSQLKYLAENSEKFVGKQVEFRANTGLGVIEWRYNDQPKWLVLVSYDELVGVDHPALGMAPAQQRFEALQLAVFQAQFGLVIHSSSFCIRARRRLFSTNKR